LLVGIALCSSICIVVVGKYWVSHRKGDLDHIVAQTIFTFHPLRTVKCGYIYSQRSLYLHLENLWSFILYHYLWNTEGGVEIEAENIEYFHASSTRVNSNNSQFFVAVIEQYHFSQTARWFRRVDVISLTSSVELGKCCRSWKRWRLSNNRKSSRSKSHQNLRKICWKNNRKQ